MIRIAITGLVGAVVLFAWDLLAWQVLGLQRAILKPVPNEQAVVEALGPEGEVGGFYFTSSHNGSGNQRAADDRNRAGQPSAEELTLEHLKQWQYTGLLMRGEAPADIGRVAANGFMVYLVTALIAAFLLGEAVASADRNAPLSRYRYRLLFVMGLGIFAGFVTDLPYWIWLGFPTPYSWFMVAYRAAAWLLVGIFLAALITPATSSLLELASTPDDAPKERSKRPAKNET